MILRIGNQAFRSLSDVLDLPGNIHLSDVDISAAFPTIPLGGMIREELVEPWTFQLQLSHAAADSTEQRISPYVNSDWTAVFRGNRETTEEPRGQRVLIIEAGAYSNTSLTGLIIETRPTQGSGLTVAPRLPVFFGDQLSQGNRVTYSAGSPVLVPFPWSTIWTHHLSWTSGAAAALVLTVIALVGPPGVLPRSGHISQ